MPGSNALGPVAASERRGVDGADGVDGPAGAATGVTGVAARATDLHDFTGTPAYRPGPPVWHWKSTSLCVRASFSAV
jgi:hypothetical protein